MGTTIASSWNYGSSSDLTSIQQNYGGSAVAYNYGYDASHRINSFSVTSGSADVTPRPTASLSCAGAYNNLNEGRALPCVNATPSYDSNGNLLSDGARTFTYDQEGDGRILTATLGSTSASYSYDPDGHRVSKTVNGTTTAYALDAAGHEIAEISGGKIQHIYAYSPSGTAPVAVADSAGNLTFNHVDNLGSVIATSAAGNRTAAFGYTPYGVATTGLSGTAFGYAGYRYDAETGLYHTETRSYDPNLGRFLQTDPIGYAGGRNTYAYTGGNPLNASDPNGTDQEEDNSIPGGAGGGGGGGGVLAGQSGDGYGGEDPGGGFYYNPPGGEFGAAHTITVTAYGDGSTISMNGLGEVVNQSSSTSSSPAPTSIVLASAAQEDPASEDPAEIQRQADDITRAIDPPPPVCINTYSRPDEGSTATTSGNRRSP